MESQDSNLGSYQYSQACIQVDPSLSQKYPFLTENMNSAVLCLSSHKYCHIWSSFPSI